MRLIHITIENYRAYERVSLDFRMVAAAAIVGENGAGKSTLVDALLWCLYGQSRSTSADGVVRIGQECATVTVDVEAGGIHYRVTRKRSNRGRGKTELDFYRWAPGGVTPLTGKTISDTQQAIVDALGVDHDTLVSASVVRQGDSDRFTRARPEERRDILRKILRIDRWKTWAARARGLADEARREAERIRAGAPDHAEADDAVTEALVDNAIAMTETGHAGAARDAFAAAVDEARQGVADARARVEAAERAAAERARLAAEVERARARAEADRGEVEQRRQRAATLRAEAGTANEQLPEARAAADQAGRQLAAAEAAGGHRAELEQQRAAVAEAWRTANAEAKRLGETLQRIERAERAAAGLDEARAFLAQREAELERARAAAEEAQRAVDRAMDGDDEGLQAARAALRDAEAAADAAKDEAERAVSARDEAQWAVNTAEGKERDARNGSDSADRHLANLQKQAATLADAPCASSAMWLPEAFVDGESACDLAGTCPLLTAAREAAAAVPAATEARDEAREALFAAAANTEAAREALATARDVRNAAFELATEAQQKVKAARTALDALAGALLAERRTARDEANRAAREVESLRAQAVASVDTAKNAAAQLDALRTAADSARKAKAELDRLETRRRELKAQIDATEGADLTPLQQAAKEARDEVARLEAIAARMEDAVAGERWVANEGAEQVARAERAVTEAEQALAACVTPEDATGAVEVAERALATARAWHEAADSRWRRATEAQARAAAALEEARRALAAAEKAEADAAGADAAARRHDAAERACAAAAVHLIEVAIPALERVANDVLGRISSRGMVLRLDTQRALKTREGMAETLDIVVRDDAGERAIEDFSGGEQFRVDLALRLGLAQLLADRDGVPVELLVIDEGGLGALDPGGLAAVKETLAGLQALYPLVLVVSHIPEVADCLPTRLTVVPGPQGSRIVVDGIVEDAGEGLAA